MSLKNLMAVALSVTAMFVLANPADAQRRKKPPVGGQPVDGQPRDFRSRNFLVHTDLTAKEAEDLLTRLETMLGLISIYWGRPCRGAIECYVVKDINKWPAGVMPPDARAKVARGAGVTITNVATRGDRFEAKATVYASADHGTPQHEAVHAYCGQTFGRTGPTWYSEGMAEMGQYWRKKESGVNLSKYVLKYLQDSEPRSLREIVDPNQVTGDSWQNYSWRWALCHLLSNNPNYAPRFRPLGIGILTEQPVSFEETYGLMRAEISFEYLFFLEHIQNGMRADLLAWDWSKEFVPVKNTAKVLAAKVQARRGWQPTGLTAAAGHAYAIEAKGTWKIAKKGRGVSGDGDQDGKGRLQGVLLNDWKLGEPFPLGANGVLIAPEDGDLYVRCLEEWNELADNNGTLAFKARFVTETPEQKEAGFQPNASTAPPARIRIWKDASGKYSIKASLLEVKDGVAHLKKVDGQVVKVPVDKLNPVDQRYLRSRK